MEEKLKRANQLNIELKDLKNFLQTARELKEAENPIYLELEISSDTVPFNLKKVWLPKECINQILFILEDTYKDLEIEFNNIFSKD